MEPTRDLAVYVLARTDLPSMNAGKLAAQVHHSGVQMMAKYNNKQQLVQDYIKDGIAHGAVYFNTTIVLGATITDIIRVGESAQALGPHIVVHNTITDPSYPFFVESMEIASLIPLTDETKIVKVMNDGKVLMVRPEVTVAWFLGDRTDARFTCLFDGLKLHP